MSLPDLVSAVEVLVLVAACTGVMVVAAWACAMHARRTENRARVHGRNAAGLTSIDA